MKKLRLGEEASSFSERSQEWLSALRRNTYFRPWFRWPLPEKPNNSHILAALALNFRKQLLHLYPKQRSDCLGFVDSRRLNPGTPREGKASEQAHLPVVVES